MQTRIGLATACVLAGFLLANLWGPRTTTAQIGGNRAGGFFGTLKVGDMVESSYDNGGKTVLRTYDDEANKARMIARVTEVGTDYIALEIKPDPNTQEVWTVRYPVQSIGSVFHVTGAAAAGGDAAPPTETKGKAKGASKTKR